jgi:penicillin-binding protein 2
MAGMHDRLNEYDPAGLKRKFKILFWIAAVAMTLLCCRLLYLQIIKGDEFQARSENNSVRLRKIKPLRGFILDTHGQVLVDNQPAFDLMYIPNRPTPVGETVEAIKARYAARGLPLNLDTYPTGRLHPFVPIRLERNINREKLAIIENHALEMPGVVVEVVPIRKYLFGEMLAQVIGYTGEVSPESWRRVKGRTWHPGTQWANSVSNAPWTRIWAEQTVPSKWRSMRPARS